MFRAILLLSVVAAVLPSGPAAAAPLANDANCVQRDSLAPWTEGVPADHSLIHYKPGDEQRARAVADRLLEQPPYGQLVGLFGRGSVDSDSRVDYYIVSREELGRGARGGGHDLVLRRPRLGRVRARASHRVSTPVFPLPELPRGRCGG